MAGRPPRLSGLEAVHRANELARELRPEGARRADAVKTWLKKSVHPGEEAIIDVLRNGVEAFEDFLKWRDDASKALGRPVEQGVNNAAISPKDLAHVMSDGSDLRSMLASVDFAAIIYDIESYSSPQTMASKHQRLAWLSDARRTVEQAWKALNEYDESVRLKPPNEPSTDKVVKALGFVSTAIASRDLHQTFDESFGRKAINTQNNGSTLKDARKRLERASNDGDNALARIWGHAQKFGSMPYPREVFAGVPDLNDEIKCLRFASDGISVSSDRISEDLHPTPVSDAMSASGSSPTDDPLEFALPTHTAVQTTSAAFAGLANALEELLPSSRPADSYLETVGKTKVHKQQRASASAALESGGDATSSAQKRSLRSSSEKKLGAETKEETVHKNQPPARKRTTPEDVFKEQTRVNDLIRVIDSFADIHQVLRLERYGKVCADLEKLHKDIDREVGKVGKVEDIDRLGKLLDRAQGKQKTDLIELKERLDHKVLTLHGTSSGWVEYFKYVGSLELDAYKLFELPQTAQWDALRKGRQIDTVGPAFKLPGKDGKIDGKLFEIRLQAKNCSNGLTPEPVFVHVHLNEPAENIEKTNVACAHLKNRYQVNRGRNWELTQFLLFGEKKDVHRSNMNPAGPFFSYLLQDLKYSNDNALRESASVPYVAAAADAKPRAKRR